MVYVVYPVKAKLKAVIEYMVESEPDVSFIFFCLIN